jgi:hypothetical protein
VHSHYKHFCNTKPSWSVETYLTLKYSCYFSSYKYLRGAFYTPALKRLFIPGVSRLVDITVGGDFLGLCDQKSSYKHVSNFGRLRSYDRLKLRIEGNDY